MALRPTDVSDSLLMRRIGAGDRDAYRELVKKYLSFCVRVAERMLGNRHDAEDVAQDVCLAVWREADRWRPEAKFAGWLYRILINRCIDYQRKAQPHALLDDETMEAGIAGADDVIARQQEAREVRAALQQLPDRQRAAVVMAYFEGVPHSQAALAMGMEVNAFQQILFRARQNMKKSLAALIEEDPHAQTLQ